MEAAAADPSARRRSARYRLASMLSSASMLWQAPCQPAEHGYPIIFPAAWPDRRRR